MTGAHAAGLPPREADSVSASAVKAMQADGRHAEARERYADLVARHQRRASRIAFHYLRDGAEADEAVQDAFVKAYSHLASFREELPFEVWFTRILINGCLDRIKARTRRERWLVSAPEPSPGQADFTDRVAGLGPSPEDQVLARERRQKLADALARLPERQRSVFMLSHYEGCTSREVSALTGLNESTVRVHLFRAIRRLRTLLTDGGHLAGAQSGQPAQITGGKRRVHP
jgi:RNA polymerase sigma-70 factor (ECF subfamily)